MSSPVDCSSPNAFPDGLSTASSAAVADASSATSSATLSDDQSSVTIANDPVISDDDEAVVPGDDGPVAQAVARPGPLLSAHYGPGNKIMATPPGCRARVRSWMTASEPEPVRATLDMSAKLAAVVETYEPFLGGKAGLLPLGAQPSGHADDHIGAAHEFFDKMGHAATVLCDSIKQSRAGDLDESLVGHLGRRHEDVIDRLCQPVIDLVNSTSSAYLEVAHALAGPYPESLWMHQVATQLLIMAEQILLVPGAAGAARMGAPGDLFEANNSAVAVFQAHMGPRGMLPRLNSRFINALWELSNSSAALREAIAALAPVTNSFIVGMSASPASVASLPVSPWSRDGLGGDALLLQARVIDNWLHLESALPVLDTVAAAAQDGVGALAMANYRLQVSHDLLGSLRESCWVQGGALDGVDAAVYFQLAEPRSLHDAVVRVSEQLEVRVTGS
ncbi:hypothetical protein KVR01_007477 [Diaporthe batatas]|uniref:uncharacterized protein n=1 Tax=Diaporthe batatas TaxID=748121 RepID=UPI001D05301D|nr:uncharacterized protein KVR01_007477 [Diaporthe batatas]KAG8162999.1 hypothetical protein KVR01_007477 [Diaporthe batatas]